jgi:mannosyltransferase
MVLVDAAPARPAPAATAPVAGVGAVAAAVSLAWSWQPSLWTDEAATISAAVRPLPELWRMLGTVDAVHGLYYLGMHVWLAVAGQSALALRLPSAVAVGLTAAALVVLVRRLGGSERLAVTSGLVCAALPRMTWSGAEGRSFALTALLAVLLTLVVAPAAAGPVPGARWAGYAVLGGLAVAVDVYLALLLLAHAVTLARWGGRATLLRFLAAAGGALALAAPVVVVASRQTGQLGEQRLGPLGLVRAVLVNQVFLGDTPTPGTAPRTGLTLHNAGDLWQVCAILLAVAGLGLTLLGVRAARRAGGPPWVVARWALPWALVPPAVVVAATLAGASLYNPRYFTFGVPAVAVLVALGLGVLRPDRAVAASVALVLVVAPVYVSQRGATAKSGTDWAQVAQEVNSGRTAGDGVYFAPVLHQAQPTRPPGPGMGTTLRQIAVAYPEAFAGLRDLTRLRTAVDAGNLTGTSSPLLASGGRLDGLTRLWLVRDEDYPALQAAAEDAFLAAAGFRPVSHWAGPTTGVTLLRR